METRQGSLPAPVNHRHITSALTQLARMHPKDKDGLDMHGQLQANEDGAELRELVSDLVRMAHPLAGDFDPRSAGNFTWATSHLGHALDPVFTKALQATDTRKPWKPNPAQLTSGASTRMTSFSSISVA